ncbi:MAG: Cache 3/Cache 2 fusion domain-containing protein, partial [Desulfuromonadales bacterium]|nr:Cache 3/Cache 2 fusion domain-containing protein [Desulfuromonadales bacterium]
ESVQQTVDANLRVAADILERSGTVTFGREQVRWDAVNQFTQRSHTVILPRMLVGNRWLGQIRAPEAEALVVDPTEQLVGGTATIFQRMNETGDMLRVATSVIDKDGQRAIGTYIPAVNPNGTPNPVVTALLSGDTFRGRAFVVDAWYITAYQPIWDRDRTRVVGALYVGVKQEQLESLRQGIMDIVVGKTGYVWVLGGKGDQRGRYIISKNGQRDNEYLLGNVDDKKQPFVQRLIDKAMALPFPENEKAIPVAFDRYPWMNPGESSKNYKSVALTYFAPWDWVIGAAYYESDFESRHQRVAMAINTMATWIIVATLLLVLLAIPLGRLVAGSIRSRIDCILNSVHDILIVTDVHDHIILLSKAAEKFFGVKTREVRSHPLADLVADRNVCAIIREAMATGKSGTRFHFEWPGSKPGQPREMQGRTSVIQAGHGHTVGMLLTIHDVTGEREVERLKSELLSTAAHELNTPLAAIIGYSELMLSGQAGNLEEQRESLVYVHQKAWALSKIVDDLLDVGRIEAGKEIPVNREEQDVLDVIRQVLYHIQHMTTQHKLEANLPPAPVLLPIDRLKVEQVLENLLSNAIKYSPQGGTIAVTGKVEPAGFHLSVADQGIGMTPEQASRVFDKFYRANSSTTAVGGTGLGLTIVKHIIDAHGGRIWVESTPEQGSTFHVVLPMGSAPPQS